MCHVARNAKLRLAQLEQAHHNSVVTLNVKPNKARNRAKWERNFGLLSAYRAREGHADVPHSHEEKKKEEEEGVKLGSWLNTQRMAFKAGELSQARQERLKMLGVEWNLFDATWERNFDVLLAYRAREGNADVPQSHKEEGAKLGGWLKNQRKAFKEGKWTGHIVSN
jgi:hypothetical protein